MLGVYRTQRQLTECACPDRTIGLKDQRVPPDLREQGRDLQAT